ncbi:aquaporin [Candidatus Saccharibacteria bacterium]|nr:aquaporin [Candidatus Saccharibacteria bacterium]MBR3121931.1 aquaporin [Candidatus Saccharibacteria bacterium]
MATKKSKTSSKSEKAKSTKSKSTVKTTVKTEHEAPKTNTVVTNSKKSCLSGFFAKKYEAKESIFTVFKTPSFYGALIGEILGTMLLALLLFAVSLMGIASLATYSFAVIAVLIAVYAISGACLNPLVTVGMMASRRMSVIRGVMYIIAEVIGAWLGWLIFNGLHLAGGETAYDIPAMTAVGENQFWLFAAIEILGAIIIAFFYARALSYKRSVFTFAAVVTGGMVLAILVNYVASAAFLNLNNNFIMNPAVAMMLQIFPTAGENFGEILGGICQALSLYAILPMIGGVVGFYLSDFTSKLSGEE